MKSLLYLYQLSVISVATSVSDKMSKFWVYNCDLCEYFCLCVCAYERTCCRACQHEISLARACYDHQRFISTMLHSGHFAIWLHFTQKLNPSV